LGRKIRRRLRPLRQELARARPDIADPVAVIAAGHVLVDGRIVTNPASLVPVGASLRVRPPRTLRGEAKLGTALAAFGVQVRGVAVDVGASAGGFTQALLAAGAARVYAVDTGHGQLLGSLRNDPRVVNLEGVNLGAVAIVERVDVVSVDVSYLALADAVPQLERLPLARDAQLVALVKPMFELHAGGPPPSPERAVPLACAAIARTWTPRACLRHRDEFFVWAVRS
jgi:23S rRNA (cytidine1920-2'-O)/16S rRNA (cytidine1409-2'-O)-methyltransferase